MFYNHARKLVLALSLFAAVGGLLPGAHAAVAAPITATPEADVRWDIEQVPDPKEGLYAPKMSVTYLKTTNEGGDKRMYWFVVKAESGVVKDVKVEVGHGLRTKFGNKDAGLGTPDYGSLGTLNPGETREIVGHCDPPVSQYCAFGYAKVTSSNAPPVQSGPRSLGSP